jgi:predicted sugar kinase
MVHLFQALTGNQAGLEIEVNDHGRRHMGLGSSIGTITAAAVALNEALGRPLGLRDLRLLIAHNYCEEAPGDPARLVRGFETNVGAMAGLHGGMVVASDSCELIYRVRLPEAMRALLILPVIGPEVASGQAEARALLNQACDLDRRDAGAKAYTVLMDLLPAMVRGDITTTGDVVYQLAQVGSKKAECTLHGHQGEEVYCTMAALRETGAEIVSMSSVGPAVFALSERPEVWQRWQRWKDPGAAACTLEVPVDNTGCRVRMDGVPIPYYLEPWSSEPQYSPSLPHTPPATPEGAS